MTRAEVRALALAHADAPATLDPIARFMWQLTARSLADLPEAALDGERAYREAHIDLLVAVVEWRP